MVANLSTLATATTTDSTTRYTPVATTPTILIGWDVGSPDLISVAIVGSVFAVVLIVCIILGCREKKDRDPGKIPKDLLDTLVGMKGWYNPMHSSCEGDLKPLPAFCSLLR